jgi:hypothetical protein
MPFDGRILSGVSVLAAAAVVDGGKKPHRSRTRNRTSTRNTKRAAHSRPFRHGIRPRFETISLRAVVAAIPGPRCTPGRPTLVIGLRVVRVSWLCAARACAIVGKPIGIAERFAGRCRCVASVARECRSYLGCRSHNQQSAESGHDCLVHFLSPLMWCAAGRTARASWKSVEHRSR